MTRSTLFPVLGAAALLGLLSACDDGDKPVATATPRQCPGIADTPVKLAGGTFEMGEDDVYAEEGPVRKTNVAGFWIDPHEVTNRQFAKFVAATGYVTEAGALWLVSGVLWRRHARICGCRRFTTALVASG